MALPLALGCACLFAAGCLYIEAVNHPPEAAIVTMGGSASRMQKCKPIVFDGSSSFDEDEGSSDGLGYNWRLLVADQGAMREATTAEARVQENVPSQAQVLPLTAGDFVIELVTVDGHGALSQPAQVAFTVADAPPVAMVGLDDTVASGCGDFVVGSKVGISARKDTDPDATCAADPTDYHVETVTFRWTLAVPAGSVAAAVGDGTCAQADLPPGQLALAQSPQSTAPGEVCVLTDAPGTYTLTVLADDGAPRTPAEQAAGMQIASFTIVTAGDRPACLDSQATYPLPGSYILPRNQPFVPQVDEVLDDLDGYPATTTGHFAWSLWHASDPVWRPVPGWDQPYLDVDPLLYAVDEEVQVRVAAGDRVLRDLSACDPAAPVCTYQTAYPGVDDCWPSSACAAWVTWEARFR